MELESLVRLIPDTTVVEITSWVERGWVLPEQDGARLVFQEIDIARVRLIRDLLTQMALPDDSIPVVLSLVDQVYELRGRLRSGGEAVLGQPAEGRRSILGALGYARP